MIEAHVKVKFIQWSQRNLRVLKIVEIILAIIVTPFIVMAQLDTPPEFVVLILTFLGESVLYFLVFIGLLMSFIFYLLIMYGGMKSYSGILYFYDSNLKFISKRFTHSIFVKDIVIINYTKNENLEVTWELEFNNSKKFNIKFRNQIESINADTYFLETVAKQFNIKVERKIEEVPFYGHPKGPT